MTMAFLNCTAVKNPATMVARGLGPNVNRQKEANDLLTIMKTILTSNTHWECLKDIPGVCGPRWQPLPSGIISLERKHKNHVHVKTNFR